MSMIRTAVDGHVATVILARPEQRNALSIPMLEELTHALGDLAVRPEIHVVIVSGEGPDFCAGADFAELEQARAGNAPLDFDGPFREALRTVAVHPVPVVARVHGGALGGGCQLMLACDLAVAEEGARIGIPSARLGIVIPLESIERLVLAAGPKRAADMLLAGAVISGTEAREWGLVNRTAPPGDLDAALAQVVDAVLRAAPLSVRAQKRGIGVVMEHLAVDRFTEGHRAADFDMMAAEAFASEDLMEGIRAFRERRKPRFRGE
jgi:enoyl-CoA hydratase/carnithine racemase